MQYLLIELHTLPIVTILHSLPMLLKSSAIKTIKLNSMIGQAQDILLVQNKLHLITAQYSQSGNQQWSILFLKFLLYPQNVTVMKHPNFIGLMKKRWFIWQKSDLQELRCLREWLRRHSIELLKRWTRI